MRLLIAVLLLFISFSPHGSSKIIHSKRSKLNGTESLKDEEVPEADYFVQFLDHFNPTEARTWEQLYYRYGKYFKDDGPVFLIISGEDPASPYELTDGFVSHLAKQFGALCFLVEHRFFGTSQPTYDLSVENLIYLNAEQALADLAYFIQETRADRRWYVFGCGYAGTLASWMRLKYPHLVHGAVADGAPLVAQADFLEHYTVAEKLYKKHSLACLDTLKLALKDVYETLSTIEGQTKLKTLFHSCDSTYAPKTTKNDVSSLYTEFLEIVSDIALEFSFEPTVEQACDVLEDADVGAPIERLARCVELALAAYNQSCLSLWTYEERVERMRNVTWEYNEDNRQVLFQMCAEFGWFASTTARPFDSPAASLDLEFFKALCKDSFGAGYPERLKQGIRRTNLVFGGVDVADEISNAAFVYGGDDPWKSLGISQSNNSEISVIHIKHLGQCSSLMLAPSDDDPSQLLAAKKQLQKLVGQWLQTK